MIVFLDLLPFPAFVLVSEPNSSPTPSGKIGLLKSGLTIWPTCKLATSSLLNPVKRLTKKNKQYSSASLTTCFLPLTALMTCLVFSKIFSIRHSAPDFGKVRTSP